MRTSIKAAFMILLLCQLIPGRAIPIASLVKDVKDSQSREALREGGMPSGSPAKGEYDPFRAQQPMDHGMDEEWQIFNEFDFNGDGGVDIKEWLNRMLGKSVNLPEHHLYEVSGGMAGAAPPDVASKDESVHTPRWEGEFRQADKDANGKLSWEEWSALLYHEDPQRPRWVDGRDPAAMADIDEDRMMIQFEHFDTNSDGLLNQWELDQLIKDAHREDIDRHLVDVPPEERGEARERLEAEWSQEAELFSKSVMQDLDRNHDSRLSPQEWLMYDFDY